MFLENKLLKSIWKLFWIFKVKAQFIKCGYFFAFFLPRVSSSVFLLHFFFCISSDVFILLYFVNTVFLLLYFFWCIYSTVFCLYCISSTVFLLLYFFYCILLMYLLYCISSSLFLLLYPTQCFLLLCFPTLFDNFPTFPSLYFLHCRFYKATNRFGICENTLESIQSHNQFYHTSTHITSHNQFYHTSTHITSHNDAYITQLSSHHTVILTLHNYTHHRRKKHWLYLTKPGF